MDIIFTLSVWVGLVVLAVYGLRLVADAVPEHPDRG